MDWWLLRWDRLVQRVTDEDELCLAWDTRPGDDGDPSRLECARRWSHAGRHVYRDLSL